MATPESLMAQETQELSPEKKELVELVRSAQQGDGKAFTALFLRFESLVLSISERQMGNHESAEEMKQEIFIQAFKKINQLQVPEAFPGWLGTIAQRMCFNRKIRTAKPEILAEQDMLGAIALTTETSVDILLKKESEALVRWGLGNMKELDRETLVAFYVKGQSLNEMVITFEAPLGTIKRRLHVARNRLKEIVGEYLYEADAA